MGTVATPEMREFAKSWEKNCGLASARSSGIVGDQAHRARGGYHISREDQPGSNYSVIRPDDREGPSDAAAAVDMTMSRADMIVCTNRLIRAYENPNDPRRKYMNDFNGTTDGVIARRWDVYARKIGKASQDHTSHVHLSIRRKYVRSRVALDALLSTLRGDPVAAYLRSIGVATPAKPSVLSAVSVPAFPGRVLRRDDLQSAPDAAVKLFQQQMRRRGWASIGEPDGFFGARLESAVKRWQAMCGLPADGVIGPVTWPTVWTRPRGA